MLFNTDNRETDHHLSVQTYACVLKEPGLPREMDELRTGTRKADHDPKTSFYVSK